MKIPQPPPLHDLLELGDHDDLNVPQHLIFHVGEELYALRLRDVRELVRLEKLMPVPGLPPHLIGVITLRGNVLPIMDLQLRFGLAASLPRQNPLVLVCQIDDTFTGLLVDSITNVSTLPEEACDASHPPFSAGETVTGVGAYKDELVAILNLEAVIDLPKARPV
jgi:purine-binding chemotaxis protein CheW